MNSLEYFGYAKLDYMAFNYIAEHFKSGDSYSVIDTNGLPLFGFVAEDKPMHYLTVKNGLRYMKGKK